MNNMTTTTKTVETNDKCNCLWYEHAIDFCLLMNKSKIVASLKLLNARRHIKMFGQFSTNGFQINYLFFGQSLVRLLFSRLKLSAMRKKKKQISSHIFILNGKKENKNKFNIWVVALVNIYL